MKQLVFANNALQRTLLEGLNTSSTAVGTGRVEIYDAYSFFETLLLNPPESAYGSSPNITGFSGMCCEINNAAGCTPCADPEAYFYYDRTSILQCILKRPH
jgi:hypothetical protein